MKFCIAGRWIEEEVNLAERDNFNYPVLIGRNMLKRCFHWEDKAIRQSLNMLYSSIRSLMKLPIKVSPISG
nr:RimK/LysX family protein [Mastigocladopsis repens]